MNLPKNRVLWAASIIALILSAIVAYQDGVQQIAEKTILPFWLSLMLGLLLAIVPARFLLKTFKPLTNKDKTEQGVLLLVHLATLTILFSGLVFYLNNLKYVGSDTIEIPIAHKDTSIPSYQKEFEQQFCGITVELIYPPFDLSRSHHLLDPNWTPQKHRKLHKELETAHVKVYRGLLGFYVIDEVSLRLD